MADEFNYLDPANPGSSTFYGVAFQRYSNNIVNASTGALIADSPTNRALAGVPVSDAACAGHYVGNLPSGTPAGMYDLVIFDKLGAAYADSDLMLSDAELLFWSGAVAAPGVLPTPGVNQVSVYCFTRDGGGNLLPGATVDFALVDPLSSSDGFTRTNITVTSDGSARAATLLQQAGNYKYRINGGSWASFKTGTTSPFQIPIEALGPQST